MLLEISGDLEKTQPIVHFLLAYFQTKVVKKKQTKIIILKHIKWTCEGFYLVHY
jgi:hypothetical protein